MNRKGTSIFLKKIGIYGHPCLDYKFGLDMVRAKKAKNQVRKKYNYREMKTRICECGKRFRAYKRNFCKCCISKQWIKENNYARKWYVKNKERISTQAKEKYKKEKAKDFKKTFEKLKGVLE